jgi:hypothetical protein
MIETYYKHVKAEPLRDKPNPRDPGKRLILSPSLPMDTKSIRLAPSGNGNGLAIVLKP